MGECVGDRGVLEDLVAVVGIVKPRHVCRPMEPNRNGRVLYSEKRMEIVGGWGGGGVAPVP